MLLFSTKEHWCQCLCTTKNIEWHSKAKALVVEISLGWGVRGVSKKVIFQLTRKWPGNIGLLESIACNIARTHTAGQHSKIIRLRSVYHFVYISPLAWSPTLLNVVGCPFQSFYSSKSKNKTPPSFPPPPSINKTPPSSPPPPTSIRYLTRRHWQKESWKGLFWCKNSQCSVVRHICSYFSPFSAQQQQLQTNPPHPPHGSNRVTRQGILYTLEVRRTCYTYLKGPTGCNTNCKFTFQNCQLPTAYCSDVFRFWLTECKETEGQVEIFVHIDIFKP